MIGTFTNVGAILLGSTTGSLIRKGMPEKYQTSLYNAMGLASIGLGLNAVTNNMPNSTQPVLFIISLALGSVIGAALSLDTRFDGLVKRYAKSDLGQGLSTAIMLFCIGTFSILGPIESALNNNHTYLFTNATLDLITSMVLATTYGIGIALSAVVLFCWQGSIYLLAEQLEPFLSPELMTEVSIIGGFLILASGISILQLKNMRAINSLPALFIPPIWFAILSFI